MSNNNDIYDKYFNEISESIPIFWDLEKSDYYFE